jgi:chaperonin GroEL
MLTKKIINMKELRPLAIQSMGEIAAIVKRTLGPGGNPIMLARVGQALDGTPLGPKITKDGVSVAEECADENPYKDIVIQAVKSICKKTNTSAGDGTTTAIVLGEAILAETIKQLEADPELNPQLVKESIDEAAQEVLAMLRKIAIKVDNMDILEQVATISANGDQEIGKVIREAFEHVGVEGVVTVDEGRSYKTTLDLVEGYQFNRGAECRDGFFNNKEHTHFEAQNAAVIIYDGKVLNYTDLVPALRILGAVNENGVATREIPPTIIIANEFSNEVLQFLLVQRNDRGMTFCAIQGPNTTHVRTGYYDDLAVYLGGTRLGNGNRSLAAIEPDDFGQVGKIIVNKYTTTLYDGAGSEDELLARVDQLNAMKKEAESPYDRQILNDRSAALTNGIARIGVGGATEFEIKEKYDRVEDALNAARAALQEGVVPGGGTTLLRISQRLNSKTVGQRIMKVALRAPFYQILDNIGIKKDVADQYANEVSGNNKKVFDARHKQIKNALRAGIIDPVKVARAGLENAVSIATLLSTAGGAIVYTKVLEKSGSEPDSI